MGALNLRMTGTFLKESTIAFSWIVLAVGTPHHGSKVEFWV